PADRTGAARRRRARRPPPRPRRPQRRGRHRRPGLPAGGGGHGRRPARRPASGDEPGAFGRRVLRPHRRAGHRAAHHRRLPARGPLSRRWDVHRRRPLPLLADARDLGVHLVAEGHHELMWCKLGAHPGVHQGVAGASFAVWAPNARGVRVVGDFNSWDGRLHPMRRLGTSGLWELFLPAVKAGDKYKYEIVDANGMLRLKADPFAFATETPPGTASVVFNSEYDWRDGDWIGAREGSDPLHSPFAVYECHLGSWRTVPEEGDRPLTYRELADQLPPYLAEHGFTHVEFLPIAEHPYAPSWGYQVSAYYAPTARFGSPDDFRYLVDRLHQAGIGVLVDWVPAHFPKDDFALARFDGTALYEHADPRQGEHPDWGTLVFNFGRNEVRNFLL